MRLRASYLTNTKKATLIHELRHRVQGRFRYGDEDHLYLFLYLYDVWVTPTDVSLQIRKSRSRAHFPATGRSR